jgi:transposase
MIEMAHVEDIRKLLHVEEKSQRQVAKELGISRHTVAKYANQAAARSLRRRPTPFASSNPYHFRVEVATT